MRDLTNKRFGRLVALKNIGSDKFKNRIWLCKCDCGNYFKINSNALTSGNTRSCGCLRKEVATEKIKKYMLSEGTEIHGKTNTRLYRIFANMKTRCTNKKSPDYKYYGKRGITICKEWRQNFMNFYNWAIEHGYKDNLTIDRIDVDGNYEPSNCRWVTATEQDANRRISLKYYLKGKEYTPNELAQKYKLSRETIINRWKKGYREEELIRPVGVKRI